MLSPVPTAKTKPEAVSRLLGQRNLGRLDAMDWVCVVGDTYLVVQAVKLVAPPGTHPAAIIQAATDHLWERADGLGIVGGRTQYVVDRSSTVSVFLCRERPHYPVRIDPILGLAIADTPHQRPDPDWQPPWMV